MNTQDISEMAAKIIEAEARKDQALEEMIALVQDGVLTRAEAAQYVAGAMLTAADELGLPGAVDHLITRLMVDQALDGPDVLLRVGDHV